MGGGFFPFLKQEVISPSVRWSVRWCGLSWPVGDTRVWRKRGVTAAPTQPDTEQVEIAVTLGVPEATRFLHTQRL